MSYVALDIGNVLVHANFQDFLKKLSKTLNITMEEATYFMNRNQKLHDLGLTIMADELRDHFKIRSQVIMEELIGSWNDVIIADKTMISTLNTMTKKHGLRVALLSNVGLEHAKRMEEVLSFDGFFRGAVKHFSCHVGARKPTVMYYHTFLQLHPEWQGCPYIDDLQENLDASKQFGFKTFRFSLEEVHSPQLAHRVSSWPNSEYGSKLKDIEKFILTSNLPEKNSRWH